MSHLGGTEGAQQGLTKVNQSIKQVTLGTRVTPSVRVRVSGILPTLKIGFISPTFPLNGHSYLVTLHNILHVANLQSTQRYCQAKLMFANILKAKSLLMKSL